MPSFNQQPLFDSGPCRFHVGGLQLRHDEQSVPHLDGAHLVSQGRSTRPITQTGTLIADDTQTMTTQTQAIESQLDGLAHDLVDNTGQVWNRVVMLRFDPEPLTSLGTRCRLDYSIDYVQVKP